MSPWFFPKFSFIGFFLFSNIAVKLIVLNLLTYDQANSERICRSGKSIWKSPYQTLHTSIRLKIFAEIYND